MFCKSECDKSSFMSYVAYKHPSATIVTWPGGFNIVVDRSAGENLMLVIE